MIEAGKSREQLINEVRELRQWIADLQDSEAERKRAKAELETVQKYAQDLVSSSLDMIIAVDRNRKIIEFNKAAQKAFGYAPEEILGQDIDILYDDPSRGMKINKAIKETGLFTGEVVNKRKNGEIFPSFVSSSLLYDSESNFVGVMGISRDITKQKQAEEEIKKYRVHLEELVEERTEDLGKANGELRLEITKRKEAEEALAAEKERLSVTLRSIGDGVIATGQNAH